MKGSVQKSGLKGGWSLVSIHSLANIQRGTFHPKTGQHSFTCKLEMFHPKGDIKRGVFSRNTLFYTKIRKGRFT